MNRAASHLDPTDQAIVEHLQRDGRMPYTRLGAAVGLSEAAVRQRVQRLNLAHRPRRPSLLTLPRRVPTVGRR